MGTRSSHRRARTPTLLQMEAVECGAAALGIVLGYHERYVPLEVLRKDCGVSRDGSKASNMLSAARNHGMEAKGYRHNPEYLRQMKPPFIVFWNFNHFLVVEGFRGDTVFLNDPASGPRTVTYDEFDQAFTGIVLTFQPTPDFKTGGERPRLLSALRHRLAGSWAGLTYVILVGLGLMLLGLLTPIYSKVFVDNYLVGGLESWVRPLLLAMLVTAVLTGILTWLREYYLARMETRMALGSGSRFMWHVLRLPIDFFTQRSSGDIAARAGLNDDVAALLSGQLAITLLNVLVAVFYAILMMFYDVMLTAIGIGIALVNLLALRYVARRRTDDNQRLVSEQGKLMGTAMNGLSIMETLKATGSESDFFSRWAGYNANVMNAQQDLARSSLFLAVIPTTLASINTALILGLGGLRVMDGVLTIGMLIAYQSLMGRFSQPVNETINLAANMQSLQGSMNRVDDVIKYPLDSAAQSSSGVQPQDDGKIGLVRLEGYLELKGLTFGYSRLEQPLISDFSLQLEPGMRVALVGSSGSGKSTIAKLIMGINNPWEGEILFDGRLRAETPTEVLTDSLAMVAQEIYLFEGSVRHNITLWDSTIGEHDMIKAAKDAVIHDVIAGRPGGYESVMQEGGGNMSGGELQRLEIARALAINPRIMVLDEATSALDPLTEQQVDDAIRRRGCTVLIVAHRLSTIRDCDEIIVLDRGKVVERGTHGDLHGSGGLYSMLIKGH